MIIVVTKKQTQKQRPNSVLQSKVQKDYRDFFRDEEHLSASYVKYVKYNACEDSTKIWLRYS